MEIQPQEKQSNPAGISEPAGALNEYQKQKRPLGKWLFWLFIIAAIFAFYFLFFKAENSSKNVLVSEPVPVSEPVITVENTVAMLDRQTKTAFPEIKEREAMEIGSLDSRLSFLNYPGASGQKVNKVLYSDESIGYEVSFTAPKILNDYYFEMLNKLQIARWQTLFSSRAILAAVIEAEKNNFQVKITASKISDNTSEVYAKIIEK